MRRHRPTASGGGAGRPPLPRTAAARPRLWPLLQVLFLAALALSVPPPAAAREELAPVLHPRLDDMEAAVREVFVAARGEVDRLLEDPAAGDDELAGAFGELGRLYLVYSLPEAAASCFENARTLAPDDFRWHYLLGAVRQERGDLTAARASLERALALEPDDPAAELRLAQVEFELGDAQAAEPRFAAVIEVDGFEAAARYGLGRVDLERGDAAAAAEHFEAALAAQPEASEVRYQLALVYRRLGRTDEARRLLAEQGRARLGFPDPLLEQLGEGARGSGIFVVSATKARNAGDLEGAVAAYRRAIAEAPESPGPRRGLASTLQQMGRSEEAKEVYREILELEPDDPAALYNLGTALLEEGRTEEGLRRLERLVAVAPDHVDGRVNLAAIYAQRGRAQEAAALYDQAIALDPYDPDLRIRRAELLTGSGRAESAVADLEELLATDPENVAALVALGDARAASGAPREAVAAYERALAADPGPERRARAHFGAGSTLLGAGRAADAVPHLRRAAELLPEVARVRLVLARGLGAAGDFAAAAAEFGEAVRLDPGAEQAHFGRAISWMLAGRESEARTALESSLAALPDSLPLAHLLARLLAAAADAAVRDGGRALALAQQVFERRQTLDHAETIAMAHAELGDFDQALAWQRQVLERALAAGGDPALERRRDRLEAYERGEPCRTPWLAGGGG